ncbi:MAG: AAA family ATPase [Bacteroidales bacterium]|jgi:AAA+ ATPase superfamily predicted ATPase|nr:AAA family ATPase [Bacteroidales bacterium]
MDTIVGRKQEIKRLQQLYNSGKPEFVAVFGRRRVGKTFLIRELFEKNFVFDLTGLAKGDLKNQLFNFHFSMKNATEQEFSVPSSWLEAFEQLITLLKNSPQKRKVIFIDEISWFDTYKSGFITGLEHFWNGWACSKNDIMLIVCGSATSWIVNNLINNHGGLYNRVTATTELLPFTLHETALFLKHKNIEWTHYQIVEAYMIMGGIPFYLDKIQRGSGVEQNIDNLFFNKKGELKKEFQNLYASLFENSKDYEKIVEILSRNRNGLTRNEIIKQAKMKSGNRITTILNNLEYSGFIRSYSQPKRKNEIIFQLIDFFTLFHFRFLQNNNFRDECFWTNNLNTPQHNTWAGLSFEIVCLLHVREIKKKLEVLGVQSTEYAWRSKNSETAVQIDLILDRADNIINICEIKYAGTQYSITKNYEEKLREKIDCFRLEITSRKAIHLLMLTTFGLKQNKYSGIVQNEVTLDDLFL